MTPRRRRAWTDLALLTLALASPVLAADAAPPALAEPTRIHDTLGSGDTFMGIRLLGAVEFKVPALDGIPLSELSGLATDPASGNIYAVSDEGALFTLRPRFDGRTLIGVDGLAATPLLGADGTPVSGALADAEGLEWLPASHDLLISFEQATRLAEYRIDGRLVHLRPLPAAMDFRSRNKTLEAVTLQQGEILTGPEWPPQDTPLDQYLIVRGDGARFHLPRRDPDAGGLTALQTLQDGRILAIERNYRSMWVPVVIRLYVFGPEPGDPVRLVAELDNGKGWQIDNFEGLTQLPDGRLLMVSDDNQNPLQRGLLVCFELLV